MKSLHRFQTEALAFLTSPEGRRPAHLLCVAPTGSGKSLIYEEIARSGHSRLLLVTPLVSLARQQARRLQALGAVVRLHAGGARERPPAPSGVWIISPESLAFDSIQREIGRFRPDYLVVDECHCLWDWGEGFRPAFRLIPELVSKHRMLKSLWLTATMPIEARRQLRELVRPLREMGTFDLPARLRLRVLKIPWAARPSALLEFLRRFSAPGLIFVQSRRETNAICEMIGAIPEGPDGPEVRRSAIPYHAGMSREERLAVEGKVARGEADIVVSTSAFGMGMDYSHLRWALLWQIPASLLTFSQMIGRVGRENDGTAVVFWDEDDFRLLEWSIQGSDRKRRELLETRDFLSHQRCRRISLIQYFEPRRKSHAAERCPQCDVCTGISDSLARASC